LCYDGGVEIEAWLVALIRRAVREELQEITRTLDGQRQRVAESQYLTVAMAAELLAVSDVFVRLEITRGNLKCIRVGRNVRIKRSDLDAYIAGAHKQKPRERTVEELLAPRRSRR